MNDFQQEWGVLHGDIERYERLSLGIKLFSVLVCLTAISGLADGLFVITLILVLWLQDGIWKTFQSRLETRIVFVERKLAADGSTEGDAAFQLYSQWERQRPGVAGLIKAYVFSALKPTVAYPYVLLVALLLIY